jgi:hypothetical protein
MQGRFLGTITHNTSVPSWVGQKYAEMWYFHVFYIGGLVFFLQWYHFKMFILHCLHLILQIKGAHKNDENTCENYPGYNKCSNVWNQGFLKRSKLHRFIKWIEPRHHIRRQACFSFFSVLIAPFTMYQKPVIAHCPWPSSQFNKWHTQHLWLSSSLIGSITRKQPLVHSPSHQRTTVSPQGLFYYVLSLKKLRLKFCVRHWLWF